METGRGKKSKKTGWQLILGLKETVFAAFGIIGLMMMSFALGALAGRGDIYRAAYSWGLMSPDLSRVAHWSAPPPAAAPAPDATTPATPAAPAPAPVAAAAPPPAAAPAPAVHSGHGTPVTGNIAAAPAAVTAKKKTKSPPHQESKAKEREEELQRLRQEVATKLKFQNSFDTGPKPPKPSHKVQVASDAKKPPAAPVKVGTFREEKAAKAKVAELQQKGIKASLKKTKDAQGALYVVYQPGAAAQPSAPKLAKKEKGSGSSH